MLRRDSGLDDWSALDASMEPTARLMSALGRAQARYAATPEHERVLDPGAAIPQLARAVVSAIGGVMMALDMPYLKSLRTDSRSIGGVVASTVRQAELGLVAVEVWRRGEQRGPHRIPQCSRTAHPR